MKTHIQKVTETANFIKKNITQMPQTVIMAGTGLGDITENINIQYSFDYNDIPNFPSATVESHNGRLIFGNLNSRNVVVMQGRFHLYEGYSPVEITFPIRVMQELKVQQLIVTNAAGGLNLSYSEGDIMVIRDHINLTGKNPLVGPNENNWGKRFPDMINAYDEELQESAILSGNKNGISTRKGIYAGLTGPSLETPAEMKFLKTIGADAVGFSTIQEVIAGVHAGMKILGLSVITNINDPEHPVPATVESVIKVAGDAAPKVNRIIFDVLESL